MPVFKWVQEELKKFSFVLDVTMKGSKITVKYTDGKTFKYKTIPYRADKYQVLDMIDRIKEEIGYDEKREESIRRGDYDTGDYKPSTFIYSHD